MVLAAHEATPPLCRHEQEAIVLVLHGELKLEVPQAVSSTSDHPPILRRGHFVFLPRCLEYSLRPSGPEPAHYLRLTWNDGVPESTSALGFGAFDAFASDPSTLVHREGWTRQPQFAAATTSLRLLKCHVSTMQPAAGYAVHADPYDVVIVTLEGAVDTIGQRAGSNSVIFYPAGELHGLRNPGQTPAIYVVFEFHSRRITASTSPAPSLLARLVDPQRWRRKLKQVLRG
jgi:mannose-6-phosphate isomerase-like protein (cupin superfamily)